MIIAIIHAKGTSERVPNKNLRLLGGKPLIYYAINNAKHTKVNKVIIDSDDDNILTVGKEFGAIALKRPKKLATNKVSGDDLIVWQANNFKGSDIIIQLPPTSPFIESNSINRAIKIIENDNINSVIGVRREKLYKWEYNLPTYYQDGKLLNSNELKDTLFETTGLYAIKTEMALKLQKRVDVTNHYFLLLSKIEAVDINTEEDFQFAEIIWNGLSKK